MGSTASERARTTLPGTMPPPMPPKTLVIRETDALFTDLYELTMVQAYWREGMHADAVFSLHTRRLPRTRNYLLACGLADVLDYLERLHFEDADLAYLASLGLFDRAFLDWLRAFRFTGSVWAVPEGTPVFAEEPLLEIMAPLPESQIVETFVLNRVHHQTVLASKAARVVLAAAGRRVVDFGLRRQHGLDTCLGAARAFHIAGVHATSNVLAGARLGIPVAGTMAHSYVQSHDREIDAFRAFAAIYPDAVLLVDTYDTLDGVQRVVRLAREAGSRGRLRAIRLDSGDLDALSRGARRILDDAGLSDIGIFASGGLDEYAIAQLVAAGAPIDGFGVGSLMGVAADAPYLDMACKLVEYDGRGRTKLSPAKRILPGRKQVFRVERAGQPVRDVIARASETLPGRPLLENVMKDGRRTPRAMVSLEEARTYAAAAIAGLPDHLRALAPAEPPYPVTLSPSLEAHWNDVVARVRTGGG